MKLASRHIWRFVILVVSLTIVAPQTLLSQSTAETDQSATDSAKKAAPDVKEQAAAIWTCPMHPQIRQPKDGKCPICAMELVSRASNIGRDELPKLMSLEEMLATALKRNPDVRAASARLRAAEADLDRTRLEVVQKLLAFREKWQVHRSNLFAATEERQQAEAASQPALVASAEDRLRQLRSKLTEVEAELPFLLGGLQGPPDVTSKTRELIEKNLLPKAEQLLQLKLRDYQTGKADATELVEVLGGVFDLQGQLADTKASKRAVLESQKQMLGQIHAIAEAKYRQTTDGSQSDVLFVDLEIGKIDLRLVELDDN